jgi:intraflagellar transport protein 172
MNDKGKFTLHGCVPNAIGWGQNIVAAGSDRIVVFYDTEGRILQEFDYSREEDQQEMTTIEISPSGQSVVIGSFDRYFILNLSYV